jgi:hypothetical protein
MKKESYRNVLEIVAEVPDGIRDSAPRFSPTDRDVVLAHAENCRTKPFVALLREREVSEIAKLRDRQQRGALTTD